MLARILNWILSSDTTSKPIVQAIERLLNGTTYEYQRTPSTKKYATTDALADAGTFTLWTPAAGKKFRIMAVGIAASNAGMYTIKDGAGGTALFTFALVANGSFQINLPGNGILSASADNIVQILNSSGGASNIRAWALGTEE